MFSHRSFVFICLWAILACQAFGSHISHSHHHHHGRRHNRRVPPPDASTTPVIASPTPLLATLKEKDTPLPPLLRNATQSDIDNAQGLIDQTIQEMRVRNKARVMHPVRNTYTLKPGTVMSKRDVTSAAAEPSELDLPLNGTIPGYNAPAPTLVNITADIRNAAALLAELEAVNRTSGVTGTPKLKTRASGSSWMANIERKGTMPLGSDSSYKVFRNVLDYGATGNGVTDDTAAIQKAIDDGNRCGENCYGSSTKNAIVYFPPGIYLVSSSIEVLFGTQLVGDPLNKPTIHASSTFVGLGVLSTDYYVPNGGNGADGNALEWYINTSSFYRQIRNFKIDITATDQGAYVAAIHYQVAQATSLQFVDIIASTASGTTQQGIFAENGSGGQMADLTFTGGAFGIWGGNQQFTAQRMTFTNCRTAVYLNWDWGWTWKSISVNNADYGFQLVATSGGSAVGSVYVLDSVFNDVGTVMQIMPSSNNTATGTTGITLDNVAFTGVTHGVIDTNGKSYLAGNVGSVDTWVLGPLYFEAAKQGNSLGFQYSTPRESTLVSDSNSLGGLPKPMFFERAKPQYEDKPASSFVHMKDYATGDGITDDTKAFQNAVNAHADGNTIIYVDSGAYILTDTVTIPPGVKLVGEAWAQIVASGSNFANPRSTRPMLRVGNAGDAGSVEMQDLIFTTLSATPGLILVEWNLRADGHGSAGIWDCHTRLGGAKGSDLMSANCPASSTSSNGDACKVGSLMMHLTEYGSAYVENMWLWVADHDLDDLDLSNNNNAMTQLSVYNARGFLIESRLSTWLYATASEHSVYYQYNFNKAKNVFAGMIQTETPYYQPVPLPPNPFLDALGDFSSDLVINCSDNTVTGCDAAWALIIRDSENIFIAGAGLYSWFQKYSQTCVDSMDCQKNLIYMESNYNVKIQNLITIGSENMLVSDGTVVSGKDNLAANFHPYWSQLTVFDPIQDTPDPCKGRSTTTTSASVPTGTTYPPQLTENDKDYTGVDETVVYVTIVNGSPYDFILSSTHTYQMDTFTFHDIPAGKSVQNVMKYNSGVGSSVVDDKGEAYYTLKGTDKTFVVEARTNFGGSGVNPYRVDIYFNGMSTHNSAVNTITEFQAPGGQRAVNFVLAGDETLGYWSSVTPPTAWMSSILPVIGDRKLRYISMPGSHDAGMSKMNGKTALVSASNVLTQLFGIGDQLRKGSRYFDIRPVQGNGGEYLTGHYNWPNSPHLGANGQSLQEIVDQINAFTATNPELIILYLSHALDTDNGYVVLNDSQWDKVYDIFEGITHRCPNLDGEITDMTMNELIGHGTACVLLISEGTINRPKSGIYPTSQFSSDVNHWSETDSIKDMMTDQISYLSSHRNLVDPTSHDARNTFLVTQWILTLTSIYDNTYFSIEDWAVRYAYDPLFWDFYSAITPWMYPNVFLLDFVGEQIQYDGTFAHATDELIALAMAINLEIASQNCYVGGGVLTKRSLNGTYYKEPCEM